MTQRFSALYTGHQLAQHYVKFRPTYNAAMFDTMFKYYEVGKGPTCNNDLAVDIGCGSGQSTLPLAKHFKQVIGCDVSKDQLRHAPNHVQGVTFKECAAENLHFSRENSVDMVTVGCAFHWLDESLLYKEVRRVLKPGGVLAMFYYNYPVIETNEVNNLYQEHKSVMLPYDVLDYATFCKRFRLLRLPFPEWERIENNAEIDIRNRMTVSEFIGFVQAIHDWWLFLKDNPNSDHLQTLQKRMENALGDDGPKMDVTFPVTMFMGRKAV